MSDLPAVFTELKVPATVQQTLLDLGEEFSSLPEEDQRELILFKIEQAGLTTEGVQVKLPKAKLLHANACKIELPGDNAVKDFSGVILDQYSTKAYWEDEDADGAPPDCQSVGGIVPASWVKEPQTGTCAACPHNRFGTASQGRGKRCKDNKRLVIRLIDVDGGSHLPCLLQLPATVLKSINAYLSDCVNAGTEIGTMVTKFRAVDVVNKHTGKVSTGLEFETERVLSIGEQLKLKREFIDPYKQDFRVGGFESFDDDAGAAETPEERKASAAMSDANADGAAI